MVGRIRTLALRVVTWRHPLPLLIIHVNKHSREEEVTFHNSAKRQKNPKKKQKKKRKQTVCSSRLRALMLERNVTPLRGKLVVGLRWELEGKKEEKKKKKPPMRPRLMFPGPAHVFAKRSAALRAVYQWPFRPPAGFSPAADRPDCVLLCGSRLWFATGLCVRHLVEIFSLPLLILSRHFFF